jgi:hypothetical protein
MAPNRLKKSSRAEWNGATLAQSVGTVIVEGNRYFPVNSVDKSRLKRSATTTRCSWLVLFGPEAGGGRDQEPDHVLEGRASLASNRNLNPIFRRKRVPPAAATKRSFALNLQP